MQQFSRLKALLVYNILVKANRRVGHQVRRGRGRLLALVASAMGSQKPQELGRRYLGLAHKEERLWLSKAPIPLVLQHKNT